MTTEGDIKLTGSKKTTPGQEIGDPPLGEILRKAREDLGMEFDQLSETTRLRPPILKSLENGEWDHLGAPVFVRGYLKSYARALGLDEQDILRIYNQSAPDVSFGVKPLASLTPPRKKTPMTLFLFLILFVGLAFFTWHRYDFFQAPREPSTPGEQSTNEMEKVNARPKTEAPTGVSVVKSHERLSDDVPSQKEHAPENTDKAVISNKETQNEASPEAYSPPLTVEGPPKTGTGPESGLKTQTLAADTKETTWIKVIVDGAPPKEYILRPGDHTEWRATKDFEVLIGNAGGIALVFNGRKLDNLGEHGKVIRLRLPKKKERSLNN